MPSIPVVHSIDIILDRTDPALLLESLQGLLHSIFFHRIFGNVQPLTREILDVTFSYADDPDVTSLIDTQSKAFLSLVESLPPTKQDASGDIAQNKEGTTKAQLSVHYFEKVTRRASWWASKPAESEICWEKWDLNCEFLPLARSEGERLKARKTMRQQLAKALTTIVQETEKTDHIPPITTNEANPFPYQIVLTTAPNQVDMDGEGWGAVLKKTLFDATAGQ